MNKKLTILTLVAFLAGFSAVPAYAHKGHHLSKTQWAVKELDEVKHRLDKLSPDADGHVAKASQAVDQALTELKAVKEVAPVAPKA